MRGGERGSDDGGGLTVLLPYRPPQVSNLSPD